MEVVTLNRSCDKRFSNRLNIEVATLEEIATSTLNRSCRDVLQWSRHQLQGIMVATSFSGRDISCKEWRLRHHLAVTTSDPRDVEDKSRQNKIFCDIKRDHEHNIEVATYD